MFKNNVITGTINAFIGILFLIFFISLGLMVALYCRPLYYMNIDDISTKTGFSNELIKENYDALIDYYNPFYNGELAFPTMPSSESGISHFEEVKVIFNVFFALFFIAPILLGILIFIQNKRKVSSYLLTSPIIMCVAPIVVGLLCAIDFDKTFILFHEIAFSNNDWYFDPLIDPVILILPHSFFLQCAVILIISVLLGVATLLTIYFITKYKKINLRNRS